MDTRLLLKNAMALGVSGILAKAITAVVGIWVTRYLGPAPYGDYSAAYAYVSTFILFAELGISQLMVQEGARNPAVLPQYFGNTLLFKSIAVLCCYALMIFFMFPAGYNETVQAMILVIGIAVGFNALNQSVYNYYQAMQKMYLAAWYQFLTTLLIALFTLVVIFRGLGVESIAFAHLFSYLFISFLLFLALRRETRPKIEKASLSRMVRQGLPFGIHRLFYYIFAQLSILVLSLITTNTELGIFSAAYKLVLILIFLPSLMTSALYPVLYQLGETDQDQHQQVMEKTFKVLSAVGIAGSTLLFVLAGPLTQWLYDGKFNASIPILMITAWLLALECMSFSLGDILTTTNRQWQRTLVQGTALALLFAIIVLSYPSLGIYGAAYGVIAVEGFIFLSYYLLVRKGVYRIRLWRQLPTILLASLGMGVAAWVFRAYHPMLSATLAGGVFLALLLALDRDFRKISTLLLGRIRKAES